MERQFVFCSDCDDLMEAEYEKGSWHCENCGKNLNKEVEDNIKREEKFRKEKEKKNARKNSRR